LELRFTRLSDTARLPRRAHDGDAGLDLYASEETALGPGERGAVGTGLAVEIPDGFAGLVLPRSGLAADHGITLPNSPGLIDSGFRGELRVLLLNTDRERPFEVHVGDRVAQLLVTRIEPAEPLEVESLEPSARGMAGFGSSGR
jgi:dUTP pyrophosphatase